MGDSSFSRVFKREKHILVSLSTQTPIWKVSACVTFNITSKILFFHVFCTSIPFPGLCDRPAVAIKKEDRDDVGKGNPHLKNTI